MKTTHIYNCGRGAARWSVTPLLVALAVALSLAGCNDEVFIRESAPPSAESIVVADGGEASFTYSRNSLECISVWLPEYESSELPDPSDPWPEEKPFPTYQFSDFEYEYEAYTVSGLVATGKIDPVHHDYTLYLVDSDRDYERVVFRNAVAEFEVARKKSGEITVSSKRNIIGRPLTGQISFSYPGRYDLVEFSLESTLDKDATYEVLGVSYADDVRIRSNGWEDVIPIYHENAGYDSVSHVFPVAEHCPMRVDFTVNPMQSVKFGSDSVRVEIPTFRYHPVDGGWSLEGQMWGDTAPFSAETVVMPPLDSALYPWIGTFSKNYIFRLARRMGVRAEFEVPRVRIQADGTLKIRNTANGRETGIPVRIVVDQPWSYHMKYEKFNLDEQ